jgi:REP element-mobilizing transposase RayT
MEMATKKRISVPGAIAHIMVRGIEGKEIFHDDTDRHYYLQLLTASLEKTRYHCYGWTIMSNHVHIIVRCSDEPLEKLMRTMNSSYAKYYNNRYERRGYLFQDRFKSLLSQE